MKHFYLIIVLLLGLGAYCSAQNSAPSVIERTLKNSSAIENEVFSLSYSNPAMNYLKHVFTLTEIYVGGLYQKEDKPTLIQHGDGFQFGTVNANSFIHNRNKSMWGEASYKRGRKENRCWNETSDFTRIYPYAMGDTLGGNLKSEQYNFMGGYAYSTSKIIIGVEGSYTACIEYWNADPRPKNLTGDLKVKLGLAGYLANTYLLGVAIHANKYKQTNDLVFYNEIGVPNIYHFTGLGTDYFRFRGAKGKSFYNGRTFGASIDLLPTTTTGATVALQYDNFKFDKVISSLNELPMSAVNEHKLNGEIGYRSNDNATHHWGVVGNFQLTKRLGTENIFGDPSGNIFPQIGESTKYLNKVHTATLLGVYEYVSNNGLRLSLLPAFNFQNVRTLYSYPKREMKVSNGNGGLTLRVAAPSKNKKWMFSGDIGADYRWNIDADIDIKNGIKDKEEKLNEPALSNYNALAANLYSIHASVSAEYSWNAKHALYLIGNYKYGKDERPSKLQYIEGRIGFAF